MDRQLQGLKKFRDGKDPIKNANYSRKSYGLSAMRALAEEIPSRRLSGLGV